MTRGDVFVLNLALAKANLPSLELMEQYKVGDKVRYLIEKSTFAKGGKRFSETIWTIRGIKNYIFTIENDGNVLYKKYWELLKV